MPVLLREVEDHPVHPMSKSNHSFLSGNGNEMKDLGHKIHGVDSSSESVQSHQEASAVSESSLNEHTSTQSDLVPVATESPVDADSEQYFEEEEELFEDQDLVPVATESPVDADSEQYFEEEEELFEDQDNDEGHGKHNQDTVNSVLSMGKQGSAFSPPKLDYSPSFSGVPYTAGAYYGGVMTGYPPHAIVHPQQNHAADAPVILPVEPPAEEPIYVNAKQYHAILRRRQTRAKMEAQNKLVKGRKPYLHESRHRHAMKRARGSGGRFLNTKQLEEQNQQHQASGDSNSSKVIGNNMSSQSDPNPTPSTLASSDTTSASRANQDRTCFPSVGFRPALNFNEQGGGGGSAKLVR